MDMSIHSIAMTLSNKIAQELEYDPIKKARISFGLEAIIGLMVKSVFFYRCFFIVRRIGTVISCYVHYCFFKICLRWHAL